MTNVIRVNDAYNNEMGLLIYPSSITPEQASVIVEKTAIESGVYDLTEYDDKFVFYALLFKNLEQKGFTNLTVTTEVIA